MARMKIDLATVDVEPVEDGESAFRGSLQTVLERIGPLIGAASGAHPDEQMARLCEAINTVAASLEELTGIVDPRLLARLVDRVAELAVTGDNVEVQIGVAGDFRVDRRRLRIDDALGSFARLPPSVRPAALREGVATLRRLLALLLLHGWADDLGADADARQNARRVIVDAVQGHQFSRRVAP
jgi:hypothetical protein